MKIIRNIFCILISFVLLTATVSLESVAISSDMIEIVEDSALTIDRDNGYISGFMTGTKYADIIDEFTSEVLFVDPQGNICDMQDNVSTNDAVITPDDSDALIIIVYGDVDGNGFSDGADAVIIEMLISGQLYESDMEQANYNAAVYADRLDGLNAWDVQACFNEGLMTQMIPQYDRPDLPEDKSELMSIFNRTINSVKSQRPGVKTVRVSRIPSVTGEGYVSQQIANSIKGNESTSEEVYKKGKSHDDAIPIARKTFSSSLSLENINDIYVSDNGDGSFTITVELPDETYDALNIKSSQTNHGKIIDACEFVPESGQEDWYTSAETKYSGVTVKVRYNSFTGDFISADYYISYQVHMLGELKLILSKYPIDVTVEYLQTISVTRT